MTRKVWTVEEEGQLRSLAGTLPTKKIAQRLKRTSGSLQHRASRLRLSLSLLSERSRPKEFWERMRALYELGWSDLRIAKDVGCSKNLPYRWRRRHCLPANGSSEYSGRLRAESRNRAARRQGFPSHRALICHKQSLEACRRGWLIPMTPSQLSAAEFFFRSGSMRGDEAKRQQPRLRGGIGKNLTSFDKACRALVSLGVLTILRREGRCRTPVYAISSTARKDGRTCSDPARQV